MAASYICKQLFNLFGKIRLEGIDFKNWVGTDTSSNDISLRGVINQTTDVSLRDLLGQLI